MAAYGSLCTEFYDLDKPVAPADALEFYVDRARAACGRVLEPMCGSGRFLLPMLQAGLQVDGVDSSPAMLDACRAHARRLGVSANLYVQDLAALELPHRYAMAFVPSGSIGLITEDAELRSALLRLRSHLQPNGVVFLELANDEAAPEVPTQLDARTVQCHDGASITYECVASRSAGRDTIRFSATYTKRRGARVVDTEEEDLMLRAYDPETILARLEDSGFKSARVSTASEFAFLAESGSTLVAARADDLYAGDRS